MEGGQTHACSIPPGEGLTGMCLVWIFMETLSSNKHISTSAKYEKTYRLILNNLVTCYYH